MLLHKCGPSCAPNCPADETKSASGAVNGKRRRYVVDLHCHVLSPQVEQLVAGRPQKQAEADMMLKSMGAASVEHNNSTMLPQAGRKLTRVEERLADMDAMGVDMQVISPSPNQYYYWADRDLAADIVRTQNEQIAELCAHHPDRLAGLGNIALQHADLAVEQLVHAVKKLGLRGVEISSAVNGMELADASLAPFWAKANELGCIVFLHPLGTTLGQRLDKHYLVNTIGQPLETTIALSHLIFGGVLDRYPGLRIVAAHGGGYLPSYIGRSNHAHAVRPEARTAASKPGDYLKRIWYDTVVYEPSVLQHIIAEVGAAQVVIGTDYPFDMGSYNVHALIDAVPGLSEQERVQIMSGNALKLLGMTLPEQAPR